LRFVCVCVPVALKVRMPSPNCVVLRNALLYPDFANESSVLLFRTFRIRDISDDNVLCLVGRAGAGANSDVPCSWENDYACSATSSP
jgi:hypothetical protein